jgi:DNA-binding CsgD family transcriptional regulator
MDEVQQVSELVGLIYDAALDSKLWPHALQLTCTYVGGATGTLMSQDSAAGSSQFYFEWGNDPEFLRRYGETYVKINPVLVTSLLYAKVGEVLSTVDLIPFDEFYASRFYKEWVAPQGWVDSIFATIDKSGTSYAFVAVTRHERHGIVDGEARRRLRLLAPHFRRSVSISKMVDLHRVEAAAFGDVLDGIAASVILVDAKANIVHANVPGRSMLDERKILRDESGHLSAVDPAAAQALRDAVTAADGGDTAVGLKGIAIPLAQHQDEQFLAHVLPLTSGARRTGQRYPAVAAVFIRKVGLELKHPLQTIAQLYALTAAELRVLMTIVTVGRPRDVAPVLGISEETVKTHLQHVFQKTGTSRQADLVKLVASFMSPVG